MEAFVVSYRANNLFEAITAQQAGTVNWTSNNKQQKLAARGKCLGLETCTSHQEFMFLNRGA